MSNFKSTIPIFLFCVLTQAQNLSIELDLSNANKTLEILKSKTSSESSLNELTVLESSKALLRKMNATDSTMSEAIKKTFQSGAVPTKKERDFQYEKIYTNLDDISDFVSELQSNIKAVEGKLQDALGPYIPPKKDISIKVVGIVGGHSTGYTFGDGGTFYISLHHMKNDLDYFFQICKHELFHNLQAQWFGNDAIYTTLKETEETAPDYYSYYMFHSLYVEGTATYLDNIKKLTPTEANQNWIERYHKNEKRFKHIFWLYDKLVVQLQNDFSEEAISRSYGTFFLTTFDELGYFLGDRITNYLLEKQPDKNLQYYMKRSSMDFISDYIKLSRDDEKAPYHFSKEFEKLVQNLSIKVSSIIGEKN